MNSSVRSRISSGSVTPMPPMYTRPLMMRSSMPLVVGRQCTRVFAAPSAQYAASPVTESKACMGSGKCMEL